MANHTNLWLSSWWTALTWVHSFHLCTFKDFCTFQRLKGVLQSCHTFIPHSSPFPKSHDKYIVATSRSPFLPYFPTTAVYIAKLQCGLNSIFTWNRLFLTYFWPWATTRLEQICFCGIESSTALWVRRFSTCYCQGDGTIEERTQVTVFPSRISTH